MTTDPITREDLEYAAKAAGKHTSNWTDKGQLLPDKSGFVQFIGHGVAVVWNPEEDDGDCARMEDAVGIDVCRFRRLVRVCVSGQGIVDADFADHANDKSRARRYASVKLAAAVGRAMT